MTFDVDDFIATARAENTQSIIMRKWKAEELAGYIERLRSALEYYADRNGDGKDYIICDRATRGRVSDVHALGEKARSVLSPTENAK